MKNILEKIIERKKEKIIVSKKDKSINNILENIKNINNFIDFKKKIIKRNIEKKFL